MHLLSEDAYCESRECFMEGAKMTQTQWKILSVQTQDNEQVLDNLELSRFYLLKIDLFS